MLERILLLAACTIVLSLFSSTAEAQTQYCVGSQTALRDALNDAEIDGTDSLVRIRSGTYTLTADLRYEPTTEGFLPAGKLTVRGGYNADCSSYSLAVDSTRIDGQGQYALRGYTQTGAITLAGFSMRNGAVLLGDSAFSECEGARRDFNILRLRIDQGTLGVSSSCNDVKIENTLITNAVNADPGPHPADTGLGVYLVTKEEIDTQPRLRIYSTSVINGRTDFVDGPDSERGIASIYNSIFSSGGPELTSELDLFLYHNRYDTLTRSNGAQIADSSGNLAAAAGLNADYVPNPGSAMVNSGTSSVPVGLPGTDIDGNERVIGPAVDRGALESSVDGTGTFVVTNTLASGDGSLANALQLANIDDGVNKIAFNIPGNCPHRINLAGALQVHEAVNFDGWTQPGNVKNTDDLGWNGAPCVILDGNGTVPIGVETMGDLGETGITVRGLAFEGFDVGISLAFGENHAILGNQFGGRVGSDGPTLAANEQGIVLLGGRSVVGGNAEASRNMISGNTDVGVLMTNFLGLSGENNQVFNNLIGLDRDGRTALPNGDGIRIAAGGNFIVGNRIGGNNNDGIRLTGENAVDNEIRDNFIGGGVNQLSLVAGNDRAGVLLEEGASGNRILDNIIGRNGDSGVRVLSSARGNNRISANVMQFNDSPGIDLGPNGVDPNEDDSNLCQPGGCAANRMQNYPVLATATLVTQEFVPVGKPLRITGTLRSSINSLPYRVEFFRSCECDAPGHGEGATFLGLANVMVESQGVCAGNCTVPFTVYLPPLVTDVGDVIAATATAPGGDTSEFSACEVVLGDAVLEDALFSDGFED